LAKMPELANSPNRSWRIWQWLSVKIFTLSEGELLA